jgi:hypothetical protein
MTPVKPEAIETDPRFPSGPWLGFFVDQRMPGKHQMELDLTFSKNTLRGTGRDRVGEFLVTGRYECEHGTAHFAKKYIDAHDIFYKGYNEGKGIWGIWELTGYGFTGGFHIWPKGMTDPTQPRLAEEEDVPVDDLNLDVESEDEGDLVEVGGGRQREFDYGRKP